MSVRCANITSVAVLLLACSSAALADGPTTAPSGGGIDGNTPQATSQPAGSATTKPGWKLWQKRKSGKGTGPADPSSLMVRLISTVLVILVLGGVGIVVVKRLLPKITSGRGRRVSLIETTYLGPKKTIHLVRVGRKTFLVGGSREGVSMLTDVTDAFDQTPGDGDTAGPNKQDSQA